jgi:hypothetical protein
MRPPIVLPAELGVTVDDIFRPVDRSSVPELADLLDHLAAHDPDLLAAIADVDRSLIWSALDESPLRRLERCSANARGLASLREAFERAHETPA